MHLLHSFPVSIRIALLSMLIGTVTGIILGTLAAVFHDSILDPIVSVISMVGNSIPSYVFALGLMYFVAYKAGLLPILYNAKDSFRSIILPCLALSTTAMSNIARFTRTQMIEVLGSDYILLAESEGNSKVRVILRHALRLIQAIQVNDYNVVISLAFIYSALYIGAMLVVDILYGIIDPRIRVAGKK